MAQVIDDPYAGNVFGRIGKGIGQGLSEQLPKEIERYRLSSGLKKIQENPGATPIDRLIQLYSTPGVSPEMAHQIEPYLRNAAIAQRAKEVGRGGPSIPRSMSEAPASIPPRTSAGGVPSQMGTQQTPETSATQEGRMPSGAGQPTIAQSSGESQQRNPIYIPTPQDKEAEAFRLMDEDPNRFSDYNVAYKQAEENLNTISDRQREEINALGRQEAQETKIDTDFQSLINKKLGEGAESLSKFLPGETLRRLNRKVESDVLEGKPKRQAIEDRSEEALNLAKAANSLTNNIGTRPFFGSAPKQLVDDMKSLRKTFAKSGELELFKNLSKNSLDIGDHLASYNTFVPSKKLEEDIINVSSKDSPAKIASKVVKDISDDDSLFSVGYLLSKIGADDVAVMNEIQRMYDDGQLNLNSRQSRELSEYYPLKPNLGDILWNSFTGLSGVSGYLANYLTGSRKKVGPMQAFKQLLGKE